MGRRLALALVAVSALVVLAGGVWAAREPVAAFTLLLQARLRASGVRRVDLPGGLKAWERDECRPAAPCDCVALVHGLGDSALTWHAQLLRPEAAGKRVLAVDLPGTDGSAAPPGPDGYSIPGQARALRAALEPVCPRWTVAGNSLGGWIAARLALDWPRGIERLVLIDAAGLDDPSGAAVAAARVLEAPTVPLLKDFDGKAHFIRHSLPERAWRQAVERIRRRPTAKIVEALRTSDLLDATAGRLRMPVRIVWGDADGVIPLAVGKRWHALVRGSRLDVVSRCGHLPQADCPDSVAPVVFSR